MNNDRELILRINDAELATIDALNQIIQAYNLPIFLFEPIIDKIHRHLIDGKKAEMLSAKQRENAKQEVAVHNSESEDKTE